MAEDGGSGGGNIRTSKCLLLASLARLLLPQAAAFHRPISAASLMTIRAAPLLASSSPPPPYRRISGRPVLIDDAPAPTIPSSPLLRRLNRFSTVGSLLCAVDCTLLPAVTLFLPMLSGAAGFSPSASALESLHELGHASAIYFVLPVGIFTAATNFAGHRRPYLLCAALAGLGLILLANADSALLGFLGLPSRLVCALHCGTWHRIVNVTGCAIMLLANRKGKACADACCYYDLNGKDVISLWDDERNGRKRVVGGLRKNGSVTVERIGASLKTVERKLCSECGVNAVGCTLCYADGR